MAKLLGLVSAFLVAVDLVASYSILRVIAFRTVPYDPLRSVDSAYAVRLVEQLGMVLAGLFYLASIIFLFHFYDAAKTRRVLLRRAATVVSIQLAIAGLAYALPYLLYLL